ncbi:hypothetical protein [Chromatium okenii]|uniref:hypothetical protein n=1 Tax=Chromatium okenii TaxID=61644 RepID=UPI001F5B0690|nr:hypothetical protein [Chromatium okenii]
MPEVVALGFPVVLGTSRKRFLAMQCGNCAPTALLPATCARQRLACLRECRYFGARCSWQSPRR